MTSPHHDAAGARLGIWLFLYTELLLFGGLFLLYAVYLARYPRGFAAGGRMLHLGLGTVNTLVLITSSLLVALAVAALRQGLVRRVVLLLVGTVASAIVFLFNKYVEWGDLIQQGRVPGGAPQPAALPGEQLFLELYYLTTGLHGLHVLIGAALLLVVAGRVHRGSVNAANGSWLENSALYWHLVDLVWIFIFPLYYLIL